MTEAVNYALGQWEEMNVFCSDGAVAIDNNASEREMKRVILNRKNSLFVGNPRGGRTAAILASLTSTCRRHDIDPQLYLTQLLTNIPALRAANFLTGYLTNGSGGTVLQSHPRRTNPNLDLPVLHIPLTIYKASWVPTHQHSCIKMCVVDSKWCSLQSPAPLIPPIRRRVRGIASLVWGKGGDHRQISAAEEINQCTGGVG